MIILIHGSLKQKDSNMKVIVPYAYARLDSIWRSIIAAALFTLRSIPLNTSATRYVVFMCEPLDHRFSFPLAEVTYDKETKGISEILYLSTNERIIFP